jgi:hypothetical protein
VSFLTGANGESCSRLLLFYGAATQCSFQAINMRGFFASKIAGFLRLDYGLFKGFFEDLPNNRALIKVKSVASFFR